MTFRNWLRGTLGAAAAASVLIPATAHAQDCNPPRILLVLDASSSMLQSIADGSGSTTKWEAVESAVTAVFGDYADAAQYGLMTFPGPSAGCSPGQVSVQVAAGTAPTIQTTLANITIPGVGAATPAGQSLVTAANEASLNDPSHPSYVIFMTDGWQFCDIPQTSGPPQCAAASDCSLMGVSSCPTCNSCQQSSSDPACAGENADGCYCVRKWPVRGVEQLKAKGITTYVVGFGSATDSRTLNEAADAAGTGLAGCDPMSNSPSCYLQATSPAELKTALSNIVQTVVTDTCMGDCGITGTRTCTAAGWSGCDSPSMVSCTNQCGTGTQVCENGVLSDCDAMCSSGGSGGMGGSGASGGMAGSGATGATAGNGGTGNVAGVGGDAGAGNTSGTDAGGQGGDGGAAAAGAGGQAASGGNGATSGTTGQPPTSFSDSGDEGGCGCRTTGSEAPAKGALGLLGVLGLAALGRRR